MNKCRECIFFKNIGTFRNVKYWCNKQNYPVSYQEVACLDYNSI